MIHLGFLWDTLEGTIALPEDKTTSVEIWAKKLLVIGSITQEDLESLLATLISPHTAVWKAPLHLRYLERMLLSPPAKKSDWKPQVLEETSDFKELQSCIEYSDSDDEDSDYEDLSEIQSNIDYSDSSDED